MSAAGEKIGAFYKGFSDCVIILFFPPCTARLYAVWYAHLSSKASDAQNSSTHPA
jgi:hypothetical protein